MTRRSLACALLAIALLALAACGDDSPAEQVQTATENDGAPAPTPEDPAAEEAPTAAEPANTPSTGGLPDELVMLTGIDIAQVLQRGCIGWSFAEYRDSGAINDAVSSFLYNAPPELRLDALVARQDSFNELIQAACEHREDPDPAWAVLTGGLGITNEDFSTLVEASCRSYETSQPLKADDAGFDRFILEVVGVDDLEDLIAQLCE